MSISPFRSYQPSKGATHYDTRTGEMRFFDGTQWVSINAGLQGVSVSGSAGMQGVTGPTGFPGPTVTIGPITPTASKSCGPEWEPFFAVWPKRTIGGKLRVGKIMKRTQRYVEYTDFASAERITITSYATKKEAFAWKLKYHG